MKAPETLLREAQDKLVASGMKLAAIQEVAGDGTVEQKLNNLKAKFKESFEHRKIERKNGMGTPSGESTKLTETDNRALTYMKRLGCSIREAYLICSNGATDLKDNKLPAHVVEALTKQWRDYNRRLSEVDARVLAQRGLKP